MPTSLARARGHAYRVARLLGDVQAAEGGPVTYARRRVRARARARWNGLLTRALRRVLR